MILVTLCIAIAALVQPEPAKSGPQPEAKPIRYEDLPIPVHLGLRAEAIQRAWPALSIVVIVPDGKSYIKAISAWDPKVRFPVLIDDGTAASREDIARFVRGYAPKKIVRWATKDEAPDRKAAVEAALCGVWGKQLPGEEKAPAVASSADLLARWKAIGAPRTGIVITAPDDPAWTAALALAAGRAQPLAWVSRPPPGRVDTFISADELRKFETAIETACDATGLAWKGLDDDIDTVTLCMASPNSAQVEPKVVLATTDCIGRINPDPAERIGKHERWAWTGQIFGTESRSAYAAMCSLFLTAHKAWLFDGYPQTKPWSDFDATTAADPLKRLKIDATIDDTPNTGERAWRVRVSNMVDAGLVCVNTKGMSNEFNLEPGRLLPADAPILNTPAMVHFVHSWSAHAPSERWTVGGRWVERGAYAYLGSVDEPYLNAFVPTPFVTGRLVNKYPFGAAVRVDNGPAWKLTVVGDPLASLANPIVQVEGELALADASSLQEDLSAALTVKDFAAAIRVLILQGRDGDVAALVKGMLKDDPKLLTAKAAELAVLPLFRTGDHTSMIKCYAQLAKPAAMDPALRDAVWLSAYRSLPVTRDPEVLNALRQATRDDQPARDAIELAEPYAAAFGREAATGMLQEIRARATPDEQGKLDREIRAMTAPARVR